MNQGCNSYEETKRIKASRDDWRIDANQSQDWIQKEEEKLNMNISLNYSWHTYKKIK